MAATEGKKKIIKLKSSDGKEFEVEQAVAMESQMIRHMIEDDYTDDGLLLRNVNSKILSKVIEYCNKHVQAKAADTSDFGGGARPLGATSAVPAAPAEDLKNWDANFVKVDTATIFDLALVWLLSILWFVPWHSLDLFFYYPPLMESRLFLFSVACYLCLIEIWIDWNMSSYLHQGRFDSIGLG